MKSIKFAEKNHFILFIFSKIFIFSVYIYIDFALMVNLN